jgi:hypothetical protein
MDIVAAYIGKECSSAVFQNAHAFLLLEERLLLGILRLKVLSGGGGFGFGGFHFSADETFLENAYSGSIIL